MATSRRPPTTTTNSPSTTTNSPPTTTTTNHLPITTTTTNHLPITATTSTFLPTLPPPPAIPTTPPSSSSSSPSPPHNPNPNLPTPTPPPSLHLKPLPPPPAVLRQQQQQQQHLRFDGETSGRGPPPPPPPPTSATSASKTVSGILRRSRRGLALRRASLAARVAAAALSMISFSVMAADKTKGWAGDSFDRYREYRYCITVNIITFVYSSFQIYMHVHQTVTNKFVIHPPFHYYFDLFFDQMLAYLMISASSAATARNYGWIVSWGSDPFTVMMNGSISMSYLAFAALAISSLISAHNLFSRILAYLLISASSAASTRNYDWIINWGSDPFTIMINGSVSMSYLTFTALAICSLISAQNLFSRFT